MDRDLQCYIQTHPQYREVLDLGKRILDFQARLAEKAPLDLHLEPAQARKKWQAGLPLLAGETGTIPPSLLREALTELGSCLPLGETGQMALKRLLSSPLIASPQMEAWLHDLFVDRQVCIQRLAEALPVDRDLLTFLLDAVLTPFFEKLAFPYREWVERSAWRWGNCPLCGSEPGMARLAPDNGRRFLICSLCHTEWPFDRLRCPFCENSSAPGERDSPPQLSHFTVDGEEAYRVDCCDRCRRYLKTVDERVLDRRVHLLAEDLITPHLDLLAREQGYQ